MESNQVDPSKILQVGSGFWASKTLLTAVNMDLFTFLASGSKSGKEIQSEFNLHDRSLYDFLDTLVALGFLERTGLKDTAMYNNAADTDLFLDKKKPPYVGGILKMMNHRLYGFWGHLDEALQTGKQQNESKDGGASVFEAIYADPDRLLEFVNAMAGVQMGSFMAFAAKYDFGDYSTMCDLGGSGAHLSAQVAMNHPHMNCISFDLPPVQPIAAQNINDWKLSDRINAESGDFFQDDLPNVDVITMGNILHDWGRENKKILIQKAFEALPKGGELVVIENIIDDDRRENAFGLMMSLNMLIETDEGYDFSKADFDELAKEVGFTSTRKISLAGPASAVIATK